MFETMFGSCVRNPKNTRISGEDDDEVILYLFRRAFVTNFKWVFTTVFGLIVVIPILNYYIQTLSPNIRANINPGFILATNIFLYLVIIGHALQGFLNWFFNIYIITNKRIFDLDFTGFLHKTISEAPLENVEDVTSRVSGTLRVILNIGTVYIQTAAESREFEFADMSNPSRVRDMIADIVTEKKGKLRAQHIDN